MENDLLFVYGTLLNSAKNRMARWFARQAIFVATGQVRGRLYEIAGYPGLVLAEDGAEWAAGELYRLKDPAAVLAVLDVYEGCAENSPPPHEYLRKQCPVRLLDGDQRQAWVYLYNREPGNLAPIVSGNYRDYLLEKGWRD